MGKNSIWKIKDGRGGSLYFQQDISNEVVRCFENQFKRFENCRFQDIMWGIELFP